MRNSAEGFVSSSYLHIHLSCKAELPSLDSEEMYQLISLLSMLLAGFFLDKGIYGDTKPVESVVAVTPVPNASDLALFKRSMLVGLSEQTEEVCQTAVAPNRMPTVGHLLNGSSVEILQTRYHRFSKTFVHCAADNRPPCHGVKDDLYISECVTVYESAQAMVRLTNSYGPYHLGTIKVPIFCECRLRRQYRDFERPDDEDDDDQ